MQSVPKRTTRHHRVTGEFVQLLHEDFGIEVWELQASFVGVPSVSKLQAIRICCWAERTTGDLDERGRMIRAWARKHGKGSYHPNIVCGPENTYGEE